MAKFVYKMQNILDVKQKLEVQARSSYAAASMKLAEEEEKLAALYLRKRNFEKQNKELLNGSLNVAEIKTCKNSIDALKSMIKNQAVEVHVAQKNLDRERVKLNQVMVERKTHEKLKERSFEEFVKELSYAENKEIDQLISFNYSEKNDEPQ